MKDITLRDINEHVPFLRALYQAIDEQLVLHSKLRVESNEKGDGLMTDFYDEQVAQEVRIRGTLTELIDWLDGLEVRIK